MPARVTVRIDGVQGLMRDLVSSPVYARPWIEALRKGLTLAERAMKRFVPGGRTDGLKARMQNAPIPRWGKVELPNRTAQHKVTRTYARKSKFGAKGQTVTRKVAFRYLGALHGSKRIAFHYRSGPFSGALTFDWFEKARREVRDQTVGLLTTAARQIESIWGRNGN